MTNSYPQIAVLGCDSQKANLYYDIQKQVWVEHLLSSCVNNKESILEFCQQVSEPSLASIGRHPRVSFTRLTHRSKSVTSFSLPQLYASRTGVN